MPRNVAPTCIPDRKACSKSSDSSATAASPSGVGSCGYASDHPELRSMSTTCCLLYSMTIIMPLLSLSPL